MALIDFTLSNARRFYSSMGNPLGWKGLNRKKAAVARGEGAYELKNAHKEMPTVSETDDLVSLLLAPSESLLSEFCVNLLFFFLALCLKH